MTAEPVASYTWPFRRWLAVITLVMAGQMGLIFWLSRHGTVEVTAAVAPPPVFVASAGYTIPPDLSDPTLLALPSWHGFSGNAWLQLPALEYEPPDWTEPPRPLVLSSEKLGSALGEFVRTNMPDKFEIAEKPEPQLDIVAPLPPEPAQSTLSIKGELAGRPLLSAVSLASWPAADILTNSTVQVGVDTEGNVLSAVLLDEPQASTEAKAADAAALSFARSAQFRPLSRNDPRRASAGETGLQWGELVFHWHTIPMPATNVVGKNP